MVVKGASHPKSVASSSGPSAFPALALEGLREARGHALTGAIRVGPRSSSVEIADSAASAFERAARRPDKGRDAHVKFRRWQDGGDGGGGGDRGSFKRGRSPGKGGPKKGKGSFKKKTKSASKKHKKS